MNYKLYNSAWLFLVGVICSIEKYSFNLDLPIQERYSQLFPKYGDLVKQFADEWIEKSELTNEDLLIFDQVRPDSEMIKIVQYLSEVTNVPFNVLLSMQYMYELTDSIEGTTVLVSPQDQQPFIVKNMKNDQLLIEAMYYRQNESIVVYKSYELITNLPLSYTIQSRYVRVSVSQLKSNYSKKELLNTLKTNPYTQSIARLVKQLVDFGGSYEFIREKILDEKLIVLKHAYLTIAGQQPGEASVFHVGGWYQQDNKLYRKEVRLQQTDGTTYMVIAANEGETINDKMSELSEMELAKGEGIKEILNDEKQRIVIMMRNTD